MRILVLGAGGTGGYFGGRLVQSGADVQFLVRPQRQKILQSRGLIIKSAKGDAQLEVKTITSDELSQSYDLIILSCKAYDLESSIQAIRKGVGNSTVILPLLNGISHLEILEKAFSPKHVLGGVVYIASTLSPTGDVLHLNAFDNFLFGARNSSQEQVANEIEKLFKPTLFENKKVENIMQDMWEKFAFLSTLAASTCLLRANVGEIEATQYGKALLIQLLTDCEAIAAASGYSVRAEATARAQKILSSDPKLSSSMHRDLMNGAKVEADAIVGDLCRRGEALGKPSLLLKAAYSQLQIYMQQTHSMATQP